MKKISRISGALLISMLLSSILSGVVLVIMGTLNLPLDMQSIKVICGSIASVGYFYFFRIFTKEIKKININEISLNKKFSVWDGIGYLLVLLGGTTILSGITDIILEFIKRYLVHTENVGVVENYIGNVPAWILLVCVVIISPVFEELLFRKVLLEELLPYGKVTAILISSMLFGMLHANLQQFLYTIFMGIVCANIVLITGKVRYAIYLHIAFNLFGAIISGYIPSGRYTILTEIIFVISAAIIVILKAKTVFIIKDEANVNKFNFKKEFCGIGFIMFMVYWIISCVDAIAY